MSDVDPATHWQTVYDQRADDRLSWTEAVPQASLDLIAVAGLAPAEPVIDVGGGASRLVDRLLADGFEALTVLDLSAAALSRSRARLGAAAARVDWRVGNVLDAALPSAHYALWHDRAVFHFLTEPAQRARYRTRLLDALRPDGWLLIATFADDGPERCSGLPVCRYDEAALSAEFAPDFEPVTLTRHTHVTPWGAEQRFVYGLFRRRC